jgi:hypothetical protein
MSLENKTQQQQNEPRKQYIPGNAATEPCCWPCTCRRLGEEAWSVLFRNRSWLCNPHPTTVTLMDGELKLLLVTPCTVLHTGTIKYSSTFALSLSHAMLILSLPVDPCLLQYERSTVGPTYSNKSCLPHHIKRRKQNQSLAAYCFVSFRSERSFRVSYRLLPALT